MCKYNDCAQGGQSVGLLRRICHVFDIVETLRCAALYLSELQIFLFISIWYIGGLPHKQFLIS